MNKKDYVDVEEKLPIGKTIPLSLQHLFAMVGATILVPQLTGLPPAMALFCSGIGTLLYIFATKGKIPSFIGSSFAFIGAIILVKDKYSTSVMLSGVIAAGLVYIIVAGIIKLVGVKWIDKALPPVVVGSVVALIGLSLAGTAVEMAGFSLASSVENRPLVILVAIVTLSIAIIGTTFFKGFLSVIPILIAMISGYVLSFIVGIVPEEAIHEIVSAPIFQIPQFTLPKFNRDSINAVVIMAPIAFVTLAEHIGHLYVVNSVVGRDFTKDPGLHRSILGDGLATTFAGLVGGPPNTTYGENIGVMAISKVYSVWVIAGAAILSIIMSFIGPVAALIKNIPSPVIGGVGILLFGIIASSGFRIFVDDKIDFSDKRNLIIVSVIMILGVGKTVLEFNIGAIPVTIDTIALATIVGIMLNLILPKKKKIDL
ncbi:Uracil permease [Clostridium bornimense]|uniref:Uracil permease n=1 Tax=Clostridium bornimense TaxID=1216932 RepID=W6RWK3_9CLOT|nr:uracil permease [Clostridium bornimense]CDM68748.1 Uracil permease [Clostridium bornimense]